MSDPPVSPTITPPLIIVCDWLPPAFGAVGQYELARAEDAARSGREVMLIGLGQRKSEDTRLFGSGKLTVVRIAATPPEKAHFVKRAAWVASQNGALLSAVARAARQRSWEIKVTGSPPFLSYQVLLWRLLNPRHRITYRVTDFYPETLFAADKAKALKPLTPLVHALRRSANRIEALSECQRRRLLESGVPSERIDVIRDASPVAFGTEVTAALRPFNADEVALLYSGNLGVAHDWRTFAEAYRRHVQHGTNRVRLWLNAGGVNAPALRSYCTSYDLPVHVSAPVPLDALAGVLLAADAHLILLGNPFWGYVFPSKTYACLDSSRPCLFIGPAESDVHALLIGDPRHTSVRQGEVEAAFDALERLAALADTRRPAPAR